MEGSSLRPVRTFRSVRPKCAFPFDIIVVPRTALLHLAYKNYNQTRGCLGWVCAIGMYRSIWHLEFPRFQSKMESAPRFSHVVRSETYLARLKRPLILPECIVRIKYITLYMLNVQAVHKTQYFQPPLSRWPYFQSNEKEDTMWSM